MAQPDQDRVLSIVAKAMEIDDVSARHRHLQTACGDDVTLRAQVEQLIAVNERAAQHFDRAASQLHQIPMPQRVGPYRLLEQIGEGGMGVVYRAEQTEPIRREVALKLIKLGMDTKQVIARFESERQALALMSHPNVARVLDAGATESGRPYFVMEYVPGEPITTFCDRHQFTTRQRLELFAQACEAVQHAHQKAIIHRDLKPSNILVMLDGARSVVKVIDFGVAKATGGQLTEKTLFTESGQMIGTPEYMSPEQAEMNALDIDTRSDIYSLGVVLYELLAGALPFDPKSLRSAGYNEIQRIIREVDPPRPSTRLSGLGEGAKEIARNRQMQIDDLASQLRGELEWIPLKALRKDRTDRYSTAAELAQDVQNYLENRPLVAGPETPIYRIRKFLGRNKRPVAALAGMLVLLFGGIVGTTWQAVRATRALAEARRERDSSKATLEFLTNDVLAGASPANLPDKSVRDVIVRRMIDPAASGLGARFKERPLIESAVRDVLASVYQDLGRADLGLPHASAALAIRRRILGDDHLDTIESINRTAVLLQARGNFVDAEPLLLEALERHRRVLGIDHPDTLLSINNLGGLYRDQGKLDQAEPLWRDALSRFRRVVGSLDRRTLPSINNLASLLQAQGKLDEAEPLFREALHLATQVHGEDHPSTLAALQNMGGLLQAKGKLDEAEPLYHQARDRLARVLGDDHPYTLSSISVLGYMLQMKGKLADAEPLYRQVLDGRRRAMGDDHPETLIAMNNLAVLLEAQGKLEEAESLHREAVERYRRVLGNEHESTLRSINNLSVVLQKSGKLAAAEPLRREALEGRRKSLGDDHPDTLRSINSMGGLLVAQGRIAEAEPIFEELYRRAAVAQLPPKDAARYVCQYGTCLRKLGKYAEALEPLSIAYDRMKTSGQEKHELMRAVVAALADASERTNRPAEAARWAEELAALKATTRPAPDLRPPSTAPAVP